MFKMKMVHGPASYVQLTGIPVTFNEFEQVTSALATCDASQVLEANDTQYDIRSSYTGRTVSLHIYTQSTSAGGAWAELAGATDLSSLHFTVLAGGE